MDKELSRAFDRIERQVKACVKFLKYLNIRIDEIRYRQDMIIRLLAKEKGMKNGGKT